ncbi:hypothetical protein L6R52_26605 [Myxococcota bacterium]|nr:hypothetical protein [Myxococcota bacterium]
MSRIGDNSDDQRIKEMQDAELRQRVDREKKDNDVRVTRSFAEVMQGRGQRQLSQKQSQSGQNKQQAEAETAQKQSVLNQLIKKDGAKPGQELQRRAALTNALHSKLSQTRSTDIDQAKRAETERVDDIVSKGADEKERVDKELRAEGDADAKRAEEKELEHRKIDPNQPREDQRTEQRQQRRGQGGQGSDDDRRAAAVQAAQTSAAKHEPRIPQEVIDKIVSAIQAAHLADGRTEMQVELKGTMLEGVKLKVSAKNGKVTCTFSGCDRDTKNLLEASKGALMRALEKRGMDLAAMRVS